MKKIIYIGFLATVTLFSCSKEQPFSPVSSSETIESSQYTGSAIDIVISGEDEGLIIGDSGDSDITDPEDENKEKSNKKAKI